MEKSRVQVLKFELQILNFGFPLEHETKLGI